MDGWDPHLCSQLGEDPRRTALEAERTACFNVLFIYGCTESVAERRGYSLVVVHELLIAEASLVTEHRFLGMWTSEVRTWAWKLWLPGSGAQAQRLWCMGWVAPWHVRSSQIRDWTHHVSCTGRQILHHWVTREAWTAYCSWKWAWWYRGVGWPRAHAGGCVWLVWTTPQADTSFSEISRIRVGPSWQGGLFGWGTSSWGAGWVRRGCGPGIWGSVGFTICALNTGHIALNTRP